ncbi:MAG TPA: hypothetical protein GX719_12995 [Gammaproteobacteria bacterium]|nr:hypothetical protein [Gammaproteobacteria bacterium]
MTTTTTPSLGKLALRTLLWLPPCLAAWYFSAPYHVAIVGALAHMLLNVFQPGMVSAVEQTGTILEFVTTLKVYPEPGQVGLLVPEVSPLIYTYGLAFFVALMLAANAQWWKIIAGAIALLPFQAWGIVFGLLVQVGIKLGPDIAAQAGIFGWHRDAIALSYQVGSLIFPSLIPVVLWTSFNHSFIKSLLRSHTSSTPAQS